MILISIFCCNDKIEAYNFKYENLGFDSEEIISKLEAEYSNIDFDNVYRFHFAYILGDKVYFVTHDAPDMTRISTGETISDKSTILPYDDDIVIHPGSSSGGSTWNAWHNVYYYTYDINTGEEVVSVSYGSKASNRVYFDYTGDKLENETYEEYINRKVLYSNVNFTITDALTNENYYRKYDNSKIKLSASLAQDLTGTEFYNISAEFDEIYDSTYTYQYKIDDDEWIDLTEIHLDENSSRVFNYAAYFNMSMYFRVLDSENNVLDENSITISNLSDYGMIISHNFAQDINGRDIYSIMVDLRSCWNANYTYQYSYDNEKYYDMTGISADNQIFYLNHGINVPIYFRILNENSEVDWSRHYNEDFPLVDKKIVVNEFTRMLDGTKMIGVQFDLSQYTQFTWDEYNLTIFINGTQQDIKDQITFNYYEADFDNFTYNVVLKLDNLVIEEFTYELNPEGKEFDDRYEQILEENLEKELGENDYSTVGGMVDSLNSFIEAVKDFIKSFFDLAFGFFNELNIWIRTFIIGIFIVMVICKIIKVVRK